MWVGVITSVGLIILSPTVWVTILKHPAPIFPLGSPGLVTIPLSFRGLAQALDALAKEPT